jgi:hypothetical protein
MTQPTVRFAKSDKVVITEGEVARVPLRLTGTGVSGTVDCLAVLADLMICSPGKCTIRSTPARRRGWLCGTQTTISA